MDENRKHWWLYVLKLEQGKYYVGITSKSVEARFAQHKNGFAGAKWTQKHNPQEIIFTEDLGVTDKQSAELVENKVTREYIKKYHIKNVRGGDLRYSGYYLKIGNIYLQGWQIETALTALLLFALSFYILFTKY